MFVISILSFFKIKWCIFVVFLGSRIYEDFRLLCIYYVGCVVDLEMVYFFICFLIFRVKLKFNLEFGW